MLGSTKTCPPLCHSVYCSDCSVGLGNLNTRFAACNCVHIVVSLWTLCVRRSHCPQHLRVVTVAPEPVEDFTFNPRIASEVAALLEVSPLHSFQHLMCEQPGSASEGAALLQHCEGQRALPIELQSTVVAEKLEVRRRSLL